jgi:hypothetical protein
MPPPGRRPRRRRTTWLPSRLLSRPRRRRKVRHPQPLPRPGRPSRPGRPPARQNRRNPRRLRPLPRRGPGSRPSPPPLPLDQLSMTGPLRHRGQPNLFGQTRSLPQRRGRKARGLPRRKNPLSLPGRTPGRASRANPLPARFDRRSVRDPRLPRRRPVPPILRSSQLRPSLVSRPNRPTAPQRRRLVRALPNRRTPLPIRRTARNRRHAPRRPSSPARYGRPSPPRLPRRSRRKQAGQVRRW